MIKPVIQAVRVTDEMVKVQKGLKWMQNNNLYVGIPDAKSARKVNKKEANVKEKVTNAELLFIHTNGSPANNIPPRPSIEPSIEQNIDTIVKRMNKTSELAMEGHFEEAQKHLGQTGQYIVGRIKRYFVEGNDWPPNSPAVQRAKRKKKSTIPRPLIDTGQMRNSITYVISREGEISD